MSIDIIQQRLSDYKCISAQEEEQAIREITQEIALMALSRSGFFKIAEFHGGTALRILYGSQRFSEDLDFALLQPNEKFNFNRFLNTLNKEFLAFGYDLEVIDRSKADNPIRKAFLKDNSLGKVLALQYPLSDNARKKIKIKLEIDTNPPLSAITEIEYLTFPLPYAILAKDLPSSFSGKIHALLCRSYLKGRDWYDFIWYITRKSTLNFELLANALKQNGPWQNQLIEVNGKWVINELHKKIATIDWQTAVQDVTRFIKPHELQSLELWSKDFFMSCLKKLKNYLD